MLTLRKNQPSRFAPGDMPALEHFKERLRSFKDFRSFQRCRSTVGVEHSGERLGFPHLNGGETQLSVPNMLFLINNNKYT